MELFSICRMIWREKFSRYQPAKGTNWMCPQNFQEYKPKRAEEDALQICSAALDKGLHHAEVHLTAEMIDSADFLLHLGRRRLISLADSLQTRVVTGHFQEHAMYVANEDTELTIVPQEEVEASAVAGEDDVKISANSAILHMKDKSVPSLNFS